MSGEMERRLDESWVRNAEAWTAAVREQRIESRRRVTDRAVVDAVVACGGRRVLDVGCGEGWLSRALAERGLEALGIDGSAGLIARARELGGAGFRLLSYDALASDPSAVAGPFDVAVCNFSLLGRDVGGVLGALRRVVRPGGSLVIQTVHPESLEDGPRQDGWREETFHPLAPLEFEAMPWFFRTMRSWVEELEAAGWWILEIRAPMAPATGTPASALFIARAS